MSKAEPLDEPEKPEPVQQFFSGLGAAIAGFFSDKKDEDEKEEAPEAAAQPEPPPDHQRLARLLRPPTQKDLLLGSPMDNAFGGDEFSIRDEEPGPEPEEVPRVDAASMLGDDDDDDEPEPAPRLALDRVQAAGPTDAPPLLSAASSPRRPWTPMR